MKQSDVHVERRIESRRAGAGWLRRDVLDRMADKFTVGDGCWLWHAATNGVGYGVIGSGGKRGRMLLAHRVMYEALVGPIPDGMVLDHLCRMPACIRPAHLEPVTTSENIRRGDHAKKRRCDHDWSNPENVYVHADGRLRCRACRLAKLDPARRRRVAKARRSA